MEVYSNGEECRKRMSNKMHCVLKFPQVQGSLQLARKVALDQIAYENEARGLKILKILVFSRCNEGTIVDGTVKNPNCTGCNVIESTEIFAST